MIHSRAMVRSVEEFTKAREAYSGMHAELFDDLKEIKEQTVEALDQGIQAASTISAKGGNDPGRSGSTIQRFRAYESGAERAANQLLAQYRDGNRTHRATPAPSYFDSRWLCPHSSVERPEPGLGVHELRPTDLTTLLGELRRLSEELLGDREAHREVCASNGHAVKPWRGERRKRTSL